MKRDPLDLANWLQELASRPWAEQARVAERYNEIVRRVASGELNAEQLREEFMRFASEESLSYGREVAQLGLEYYASLLDLGRTYHDRFYDRVLETQRTGQAASGGRGSAAPRQVTMDLRGPLGGEAAGAFVIENRHGTTAAISFRISDFVDTGGGTPFRPPLELRPSWLSLAPHEEAEISIRLPLSAVLFTPGHQYWTRVVVHGHDDLELIVTVTVEPASEPATRVSVVASPQATPAAADPKKEREQPEKSSSRGRPQPRKSTPRSRGPRERERDGSS